VRERTLRESQGEPLVAAEPAVPVEAYEANRGADPDEQGERGPM